MATRLEILIAGEPLDLFDGEESKFYITKIIHDIRQLDTRNGDFSKSITIPLTPKNRQLLGDHVPTAGRNQENSISNLPVDVFIGGVPVLDDSFLAIGQQSMNARTLEITVLGGASLFFNSLSDKPVRELDFTELNLEWSFDGTGRDLNDILTTTDGICFARSQWYSNESRLLYLEQGGDDAETLIDRTQVGESGFWMYCKTVMDKIFSNLDGITVDQSKMDSLYSQIGFAVPVPIVHESFESGGGYYAEVINLNPAQSFPTFTVTVVQYVNVVEDNNGLWNGVDTYTIAVNSFINIRASGLFKHSVANGTYTASVVVSGQTIWSEVIFCERPTSYYGFNAQVSANVVAGDTVYVFVLPQLGSLTPFAINGGSFTIENQGAGRGRFVDVSPLLPEMSQRDFVKEIFKIQSIIPVEQNKVVTLEYFESIRTNKINDFIKLDVAKEQNVFSTLPSYGRTNIFKYADNDAVIRTDMNGEFSVSNVTLQNEVVKIELAFSACDNHTTTFGESGRGVTVPNYELEWDFVNDNKIQVASGSPNYTTTDRNDIVAGDFISFDNQYRRVLAVIDDFNGITDAPFPATLNDRDWNHWKFDANDVELHLCQLSLATGEVFRVIDGASGYTFTGCITTQFSNALKFSGDNGLISTYYDLIAKSMNKPFIIQAWANLGVVLFLQTNSTLPIYIEEFDAYFYLNKMEQWKYNQGTRLELIQLNI